MNTVGMTCELGYRGVATSLYRVDETKYAVGTIYVNNHSVAMFVYQVDESKCTVLTYYACNHIAATLLY